MKKKRYLVTPREKIKVGEVIKVSDESVLLIRHGTKVDHISLKEIETQLKSDRRRNSTSA